MRPVVYEKIIWVTSEGHRCGLRNLAEMKMVINTMNRVVRTNYVEKGESEKITADPFSSKDETGDEGQVNLMMAEAASGDELLKLERKHGYLPSSLSGNFLPTKNVHCIRPMISLNTSRGKVTKSARVIGHWVVARDQSITHGSSPRNARTVSVFTYLCLPTCRRSSRHSISSSTR